VASCGLRGHGCRCCRAGGSAGCTIRITTAWWPCQRHSILSVRACARGCGVLVCALTPAGGLAVGEAFAGVERGDTLSRSDLEAHLLAYVRLIVRRDVDGSDTAAPVVHATSNIGALLLPWKPQEQCVVVGAAGGRAPRHTHARWLPAQAPAQGPPDQVYPDGVRRRLFVGGGRQLPDARPFGRQGMSHTSAHACPHG
jgi:hypothetical protein